MKYAVLRVYAAKGGLKRCSREEVAGAIPASVLPMLSVSSGTDVHARRTVSGTRL
jgi:hypothetical protein